MYYFKLFFILFAYSTSVAGYLHSVVCPSVLPSSVTSKNKIKFHNYHYYYVECFMSFLFSFWHLAWPDLWNRWSQSQFGTVAGHSSAYLKGVLYLGTLLVNRERVLTNSFSGSVATARVFSYSTRWKWLLESSSETVCMEARNPHWLHSQWPLEPIAPPVRSASSPPGREPSPRGSAVTSHAQRPVTVEHATASSPSRWAEAQGTATAVLCVGWGWRGGRGKE